MNKNTIEPVTAGGAEQKNDITTTEKVYVFRKLEAADMFLMFKILSKIGINEFAECFGKDTIQKTMAALTKDGGADKFAASMGIAVMLEIANVVVGNLPKCEQEIYQMLSNTSNLTVNEVKTLDFPTFTAMVIDFIKKDDFKDFIKVVSTLFK